MSDEAQAGLRDAMMLATRAFETVMQDPSDQQAFRVWRDASDAAVKWHRELRRQDAEAASSFEDELAKLIER